MMVHVSSVSLIWYTVKIKRVASNQTVKRIKRSNLTAHVSNAELINPLMNLKLAAFTLNVLIEKKFYLMARVRFAQILKRLFHYSLARGQHANQDIKIHGMESVQLVQIMK